LTLNFIFIYIIYIIYINIRNNFTFTTHGNSVENKLKSEI